MATLHPLSRGRHHPPFALSISFLPPFLLLFSPSPIPPIHPFSFRRFFFLLSPHRARSHFSFLSQSHPPFLDSPTRLRIPVLPLAPPRRRKEHPLVLLRHATPPTSTNGAKLERVLVRMHARFALPPLFHPSTIPFATPLLPATSSNGSATYLTISSYLIYLFLSPHPARSPFNPLIFWLPAAETTK